MKYLITTFLLLPAIFIRAQHPFKRDNSFFIRGHVDNPRTKCFGYGLSAYLDYRRDSISIDEKGNFAGKVRMEGPFQDLQLVCGDSSLNIYAQTGDTIDVHWNDAAVGDGILVKNTSASHDRSLQAVLLLLKLYGNEYSGISQSLFARGPSDSAKFARVDDFYNREMKTLYEQHLDSPGENKIGADIYYQCTSLLMLDMLLPRYSLKSDRHNYMLLSEADFHNSDTYRNFLFNYLRVEGRLLNGYKLEGMPEEKKAKAIPYSPALDDYYNAMANIKVYEIRDWFMTKAIVFDFEEYSFDDAVQAYQDFITKMKVKEYADTLRNFYTFIQRLKPGADAPGFTLADEHGKAVSLSDFRGKVVMIDFWGVGCGPCMSDIRNALPAIHDRYKGKKIVFLNICVDSETEGWKKSLAAVPLTGVNLLATGWVQNPVCQTYGINAIPHYYLIDADGKIAANNGMSPYMTDKIDAALAKVIQ